ncbi:hypothetical protein [Streptosporangium sp. NPDC001681]|uniref:hypothetical protein n=1 Tax=Streptosporangium sp. NPDC001681 TaxID=3154395 RepID=UPI0033325B4C
MSYNIATEIDLESYDLETLESFIKVDQFNALHGRDLIINPALGLELIYAPIGYTCNTNA